MPVKKMTNVKASLINKTQNLASMTPSKKSVADAKSTKHKSKEAHKSCQNAKEDDALRDINFNVLGKTSEFPDADKLTLLAAILCRGGGVSNVENAVKTALMIYDSYHNFLEQEHVEKCIADRDSDEFANIRDVPHYTYSDAVKIITSQKRLNRAKKNAADFLKYLIKDSEFKTEPERTKIFNNKMQERIEKGYTAEEVVALKVRFEDYFFQRRKKKIDK